MAERTACPIWQTPALLLAGSQSVGMKVLSPRAGGEYRISREAMEDYPSLNDQQKAQLTNWLVGERRFATSAPLITSEAVKVALNRRPLRFSEKRERFFRAFLARDVKPGDKFPLYVDDLEPHFPDHPDYLWAEMGIGTFMEGRAIIKMLCDEQYLEVRGSWCEILPKGLEKLEELQTGGADTLQAFVAMWFDPSMREAWRTGFAPAIRDAGYEPFRIDGLQHNGKIDDAIVAEIKRSRFLIADFTCGGSDIEGKFQPNPRGGVYYEAGLAHGLGMEVIFTCREDRMDHLHFDTRQFAHIVWKEPADLRDQLYNRIAATLGEAPAAPGRGKGNVDPPPS